MLLYPVLTAGGSRCLNTGPPTPHAALGSKWGAEAHQCFKLSLPPSGGGLIACIPAREGGPLGPSGEPSGSGLTTEKTIALSGKGGEKAGDVPFEMELEPAPGKASQESLNPKRDRHGY